MDIEIYDTDLDQTIEGRDGFNMLIRSESVFKDFQEDTPEHVELMFDKDIELS